MKLIKRRKEGEYHNTHFIMWQYDNTFIRFFLNVFSFQVIFDFRRPNFSLRWRKQVSNNDPTRCNNYI